MSDTQRDRRAVSWLVAVGSGAGLMLVTVAVALALWASTGAGVSRASTTTVTAGNAPAATVDGDTVQLTWTASTLSTGGPVTGYVVRRYDAGGTSQQPIVSGSCASTVAALTCSETSVPNGTWRYSVTPAYNNWRGAESPKTSASVAAGALSLTPAVTQAPATLTGAVRGFTVGQILRFYLDSAGGTELSGTYGGVATPTAVTSHSDVNVTVNLPAGASQGTHTVLAVTTPSGDNASVTITVDSTAPPVPTISSPPANPGGSTASVGFGDTEAGVGFECQLDGGGYSACTSPVSYAVLTQGSHVFDVRAVDVAGNRSASVSTTWMTDTTSPTQAITFPAAGSALTPAGYTAGCGTASTGDICGTAADTGGAAVNSVQVTLRQGSGLYWNGTSFASAGPVQLPVTGTTSWTFGFAAANFPADGTYTLTATATDTVGNVAVATTRTFTLDGTPPTPVVTFPTNGTVYSSSGYLAGCGTSATEDMCGTAADPSGISTVRLSLQRVSTGLYWDGTAFAAASSVQFTPAGTTSWNYPFVGANFTADGAYTLRVQASDTPGNVGSTTSTFTVDKTAPTSTITFPGSGSTYNAAGYTAGCGTGSTDDMCGTAADASGVSVVQVSLQRITGGLYWNGTSFASASPVQFTPTGTTSWSYAFAGASFPADGSYTLRATATDAAGNVGATASSTFTVDRIVPAGSDVQTTSNNNGKAEEQDTFTLTYSETMSPTSILAGWSGASISVTVRVNDGGTGNDTLTVWNSANSTQLNLGTVNLGRKDYVTSNVAFGPGGPASTMVRSGAVITLTLGKLIDNSPITNAAGAGVMIWTPSAAATDVAGNSASTAPATESGALDLDF